MPDAYRHNIEVTTDTGLVISCTRLEHRYDDRFATISGKGILNSESEFVHALETTESITISNRSSFRGKIVSCNYGFTENYHGFVFVEFEFVIMAARNLEQSITTTPVVDIHNWLTDGF